MNPLKIAITLLALRAFATETQHPVRHIRRPILSPRLGIQLQVGQAPAFDKVAERGLLFMNACTPNA